jgi:hypothetical protein
MMNAPPSEPYGAPNPYAAPQVQGVYDPSHPSQSPSPVRLDVALYTSKHVALATFLGSPLGGTVLLALNESRIGRAGAAIKALLAGLVATGFLITLSLILPANIPRFPIAIGSVVVMSSIAKARQAGFVAQHFAAGGKQGSGWAAAGIGILSLLVALVPLVAILLVAELATGH